MGFYETLNEATREQQEELFRIPFVQRALEGDISLDTYRAFLSQAYHHVKHTVPLLMATGARVGPRLPWVQRAICEYIDEEQGHEAWILNDLAATGAEPAATEGGRPDLPCELMVSYAYDQVQRGNPMSFFGMVHVLEGTSVRGATRAAQSLQQRLGVPGGACTYLTSHGSLDQGHVHFFAELMDQVDAAEDREQILHSSRAFFHLYGNIFRRLPL